MNEPIRRVPHASHWGGYTLLVAGNEIVGAEPYRDDPSPSPIIHSVKYWSTSKHRIERPMARRSWLENRTKSKGSERGREEFVPISWDEALTVVAREINRVRKTHGNSAIFAGSYGWTSCGRVNHAPSLLKRLLNLLGGYTGVVDTYSIAAGPAILRHVLGSDDACVGRSNTLDTIAEHTQTLVVFGALSPRTAQQEAGGLGRHEVEHHLKQLASRGVRIVHVSPLRDDLPDWTGAEWWPIKPNTDTALMLALAGEILASGAHDRNFLDRCCSGVDVLLDYLAGKNDGVAKTAEWAAPIVGLPAAHIKDLARQLTATRTMITVSWSLQRAHHGEQPFWAAVALACLAGQVGLPGGGFGFGYGSLGGVGAAIPLTKSAGISQLKKPNNEFIPVARIADLLLKPGERFTYQGETHAYPDTRLVYWAGGNPFHHHQDLNRLSRAWAKPETIVVQDPMWTATAQRADIVLPASTSIERNDLAFNRRSDLVQAMKQAIAPVGDARSDYEIFSGLAARLGVEAVFTERRHELDWVRRLYNDIVEDARHNHQHPMPDFDTFWSEGVACLPTRKNYTYLADFRRSPSEHALKTESGRIVLGSTLLSRLNYDDCQAHPAWLPPAEWLGDGDGPHDELHLISHQPTVKLHSQLDDAPLSLALKRNGREQIRINPHDARVRGIEDGMTVRIWNMRGQCLASAALSDAVRTGVVVLPTGAWLTTAMQKGDMLELAGNPNVLTLDIASSKFGQGCAAHTCLVRIAPWPEQQP